jgi:hypothetical protein
MCIGSKFENVLTFKQGAYVYNRFSLDKIEVLTHSEDFSQKYYLMRTMDDTYSVIIGEINEKNNFLQNSGKNISEQFFQIYSKLDQNNIEIKKVINLPSFNFQTSKNFEFPKFMSDIQINIDGCTNLITQLFQGNEVTLASDPNFDFSCNFSNLSTNSDEIVTIKNDFIFAIVNLEILTDFNMPVVSVSIINKDNFTKC